MGNGLSGGTQPILFISASLRFGFIYTLAQNGDRISFLARGQARAKLFVSCDGWCCAVL
jgi:hypothetical protein